MPKYKLINTSNGEGKVTNHIKNVTFGSVGTNSMVDSPLDEGKAGSGLGMVDDNHISYFKRTDWDMDGNCQRDCIVGKSFRIGRFG